MKKSLLLVISICGLCLLSACGAGSGGSTPPPASATHFAVTAPATASAGMAFSFTVTALDSSNNIAAGYSGTAHFTSTDAQAALPANSTLTNGTGIFSVTLKTAAAQTITATDTVKASITGTSSSITVTGSAAATHFSVAAPVTANVGTAFTLTVTALDASNSVATTYLGTVRFTSTDAQAVLPASSTLTNGTGTFSATLKTAGAQTISATDSVAASITGTSSSINVSVAGVATHFSVLARSLASPGIAFNFTVTALDASNNVVTSYSGTVHFSSTSFSSGPMVATNSSATVHFTSTNGQPELPTNSMLTNGTGTFSATLPGGHWTITATDTVNVSITGTSGPITVIGGTSVATHFSVSAPATATAGTAVNFGVKALDASNNVVTNFAGTIHFTSTDVQAVLPTNSTLTNGTGTFSATMKTSGSQTITATDTVTASITGASNAITVFATCTPKGAQCPLNVRPPCCPGLTCEAEGDRAFCEPSGAASPFSKKGDSFASPTPERESRFTATCSMGTARESHTVTLLGNGLVLITGGDDRTVSLATAELFNPESHSFAAAGDMANARAMHTATLLSNGSVLVIGGRDAGGRALATAELFDPNTMSFTPVIAGMSIARESHAATLLNDGKVLITGGDKGTVTLATAEMFDPTSATFAPTGRMHAPREFHTATLLKNGKVLVIGGRDADGKTLATAELFDPTNGTFTSTGSMDTPRESHTATLLNDGRILITGGDSGTESLATAELFDPTSGRFAATGSMHAAREFHTATLRNDGTVLVAGGAALASAEDGSAQAGFLPESSSAAELFDPASGSFIPTSDMANARAKHAAILLRDGRVLVTGGINPDISVLANSLASAELYQ
jgi:hypothetical protein